MTRSSLQVARANSNDSFSTRNPQCCFKVCVAIATACWMVSSASAASISDLLKPNNLVAEAGAPIPVSGKSYTWKDYNKQHADWCKRRILMPFEKVASGQQWKDEARKFLEEASALWLHDISGRAPSRLCAEGRKLLSAGCDDPVVRYFTFWLERVGMDAEELHEFRDYEKALRQLEKELRYPRAIAHFVAIDLINAQAEGQSVGKKEKMKVLDKQIVELTREMLEEGSYDGDDNVLFVRHSLHTYSNRHLRRIGNELGALYAQSNKLRAWAKHTLLGYIEVFRAWESRGTAWKEGMKENAWTGYREHLEQARAELVEAWKLRPDRPEAATEMIRVIMSACKPNDDSLRLWFDRAVKAQRSEEHTSELQSR